MSLCRLKSCQKVKICNLKIEDKRILLVERKFDSFLENLEKYLWKLFFENSLHVSVGSNICIFNQYAILS